MGGHRQPRARPAILAWQDKKGIYEAACRELAVEINWEPGAVCFYWSEIAKMRGEAGEPQAIAEYLALRNVREALDCRGREAS